MKDKTVAAVSKASSINQIETDKSNVFCISIPAIRPIIAEIAVPINILHRERTNSKSPVNCEANTETINTKIKPINPPIKESITASNKN